MPVLGERIGQCVADGEITDRPHRSRARGALLRPRVPGPAGHRDLPLAELVDRQFYRLAHWRVADEELNYRRFFDVGTLVAIRVEDAARCSTRPTPAARAARRGRASTVCASTTPTGWPTRAATCGGCADATGGAWVVVEKILEGDERLPADWPCAGTTGYDALLRVGGLFVDPAGAEPLGAL